MSDGAAKHLAACLQFARAVASVFPIDEAADREVDAAFRRYYAKQGPPRKIPLKRKVTP